MAEDERRKEAVRRLKAKRDFRNFLVVFVFVNVVSIVIWALSGGGYFWPGWVLFGTGVALFWTAYDAFGRKGGITEEEIQREMRREGGDPVA